MKSYVKKLENIQNLKNLKQLSLLVISESPQHSMGHESHFAMGKDIFRNF